jgi:HK97 family phage major capsid protein
MATPDGVVPFDFLNFIDSTREGGPVCAREHGISRMIREACPISASRAGLPLPTRQLLRDLQLTNGSGVNLAVQQSPLVQLAGAARPVLVFERAGILPVEVNDANHTSLPRWRGDAGGWVIEGQPLTAPDLTLSAVACSAHMCGAHVSYSRRLRLSTNGDLQGAVLVEMQRQVTQALEDGLINGDGENGKPLGLLVQAEGAVPFAGSAPTWAEILLMIETLADADGDLSNAVWMAHPSTAVAMLGTERVVGSGVSLVEAAPGPRWSMAGLSLVVSTAIPEGSVVLLDRRAVVPVFFGAPQLIVNPFSGSNSITGMTTVVVMNYADLGVVEPGLIVVGSA